MVLQSIVGQQRTSKSLFYLGHAATALLACLASCYATGDPMELDTGAETGGYETGGGGEPLLTFWISETTNFAQSSAMGCPNTNLNQVGAHFRDILEDDGWVGTYDLNGQTTRLDFADPGQVVGGLDDAAADSVAVAVYAGHGNINLLQWGNPDGTNNCGLTPSTQMRLGRDFGDTARLAAFVTSCTMNVPNLQATIGASSVGQYVGWHNSPAVNDFVLRDFYDTTNYTIEGTSKALTNRLSWMSVGQTKPGLGSNSPVIFTEQGVDDDVQARHFGARISEGTGTETIVENPGNFFRVTWVDNGGC